MSAPSYFVIIGKNDNPIYECELSSAKRDEQAQNQLKQFIVHAALDYVEEAQWGTNNMYLKIVDKFNESFVSSFVTAGYMRFMLMHDAKNEEGIKNFFTEVHELYLKVLMNPFYEINAPITSPTFDARVRALAKRL